MYLAAETGWGTKAPIIPHPAELVLGFLAFAALYYIVAKFAVPRFEEAYGQRREAIEGGIERAERAQAEADAAREQYTASLTAARAEAARIRTEAQAERKSIVDAARAEAEAEVTRVRERADAALAAEVSQARGELSREVSRLAVDLASRIVGENLADTDATRRTVDRFLADLEQHVPAVTTDGHA